MREIIILGDTELGSGWLTDDFISDIMLAQLIKAQLEKVHPVEIVFNGDTFDFVKCPYELHPPKYTRYITEEIAVKKLRLMHKAHKQVFDALRLFLEQDKNRVTFIIGNHDQDLFFPNVQKLLHEILGDNVSFPGLVYEQDDVHIEHGHQHDTGNKVDPKKPFIEHKGEMILNYPFVSYGVASRMFKVKEDHPFLERIRPRDQLFSRYPKIAKKVNRKATGYFIKSLAYYPIRHRKDLTYKFPSELLREAVRRLRRWDWEVSDVVANYKKSMSTAKLHVFGHMHDPYIEYYKGAALVVLGTWRDEYILRRGYASPAPKQYVQVIIDKDVRWQLCTLPLRRSSIRFKDIVGKEHLIVKQVKEEEDRVASDLN